MYHQNYVKNSFDKLIFSYPNNNIVCEDSNSKIKENSENFNIENLSQILTENNAQNVTNESIYKDGFFCNDECSNKFFEFINKGASSKNLNDKNTEQLRILLANVYNNGYNQGYLDNRNSFKM